MLTLQLFDNFENDTLHGRSKGGGWVPHGGGGLVSQALVRGTCRASIPVSDQMGVGAMVPQFTPSSKHRGRARPVPLNLWAYLPVSNGNSLIVFYLVTCLFIPYLDYKSLGGGGEVSRAWVYTSHSPSPLPLKSSQIL